MCLPAHPQWVQQEMPFHVQHLPFQSLWILYFFAKVRVGLPGSLGSSLAPPTWNPLTPGRVSVPLATGLSAVLSGHIPARVSACGFHSLTRLSSLQSFAWFSPSSWRFIQWCQVMEILRTSSQPSSPVSQGLKLSWLLGSRPSSRLCAPRIRGAPFLHHGDH